MRASLLFLFTAWTLTACGGDDEKTDDGESTGDHGTCDLRATRSKCIEATGPAPSIDDQYQGCVDAGGAWTTNACPTDDLIGCCTYTFGLEFRDCFYPGSSSVDPESDCEMAFDDAVWTPAAE